jgi:hypothetical protein
MTLQEIQNYISIKSGVTPNKINVFLKSGEIWSYSDGSQHLFVLASHNETGKCSEYMIPVDGSVLSDEYEEKKVNGQKRTPAAGVIYQTQQTVRIFGSLDKEKISNLEINPKG